MDLPTALNAIKDDYFPDGNVNIEQFEEDLEGAGVGSTLSDIFRQRMLDKKYLTTEEQEAFSFLFQEELERGKLPWL